MKRQGAWTPRPESRLLATAVAGDVALACPARHRTCGPADTDEDRDSSSFFFGDTASGEPHHQLVRHGKIFPYLGVTLMETLLAFTSVR
jgi:hypothetical protein